jgi:hypothetical protein
MTMQGLWIGGNINLGFMVDDRKYLPSGIPNPNWRKFEPFEPCAAVVRELFETFIRFGGNTRKTLAHVYEHGPHFPDFDDPEFQRLVPPGFICAKPNGDGQHDDQRGLYRALDVQRSHRAVE